MTKTNHLMPYNHTATGSPNERELTPEEYRQLNREIEEKQMINSCNCKAEHWEYHADSCPQAKQNKEAVVTNELLKRLRVDYISEITIGDVHDAADEITQLRGNLGLAEDGLASATQEIEQLRARLNHLEFAITQAADSFKDLKVSQHLLGHPVIGETCARAERVMRSLLAGSKPTPDEPCEQQNATPGATWSSEDSVRQTAESSRPRELLPQQMQPDTRPLTHQEIFSAVHHHAAEIVRLTITVPVQCTESDAPLQEAAERRWSLLTRILDESAETGELPSGLHEAFQMGGDAMAEWLDRSPMPWNPTTSSDVSIHDQTPSATSTLSVEQEKTMTDNELLEWIQGLIANVENARAVGDHDMDEDKRKLEILRERLAQRR